MTIKIILTFDLHVCDSIKDIHNATKWLRSNDIPAIYFVPTNLLNKKDYLKEVRYAMDEGIEIGTHGHRHDEKEIFSLMSGSNLEFMEVSTRTYKDALGIRPRVFRAPHWCTISEAAYKRLGDLGYKADMSTTPQRLSIFSSLPYSSTWLCSKRVIHTGKHGLVIAPTSSFIFPLGNPTFSIFRKHLSLLFLQFFKAEAFVSNTKVINIMFHVGDLNKDAQPKENMKASLEMIFPKKFGGFGFKHLLRQQCTQGINSTTMGLLRSLKNSKFCSLDDILGVAGLNQSRQPQAPPAA